MSMYVQVDKRDVRHYEAYPFRKPFDGLSLIGSPITLTRSLALPQLLSFRRDCLLTACYDYKPPPPRDPASRIARSVHRSRSPWCPFQSLDQLRQDDTQQQRLSSCSWGSTCPWEVQAAWALNDRGQVGLVVNTQMDNFFGCCGLPRERDTFVIHTLHTWLSL